MFWVYSWILKEIVPIVLLGYRSFFPPPKCRTNTLICLCSLQNSEQVQVVSLMQLDIDLFTLFEKKY